MQIHRRRRPDNGESAVLWGLEIHPGLTAQRCPFTSHPREPALKQTPVWGVSARFQQRFPKKTGIACRKCRF